MDGDLAWSGGSGEGLDLHRGEVAAAPFDGSWQGSRRRPG